MANDLTFHQVVKANEVGGILSTGKPIKWEMVTNAPDDVVKAHKEFVQACEKLNEILKPHGTSLWL